LLLIHAVETSGLLAAYNYLNEPDLIEPGRQVVEGLAAAIRTDHPDLTIATDVVIDDAAHALIAMSDTATLVVVGHRGHGGFHDLVLGSTSLQTAMHAHCPVAVIRPATDPPPDAPSPGRIVVGVDDSDRAQATLTYAIGYAELHHLPVTAVQAWQPPVAAGPVPTMFLPPDPGPGLDPRRRHDIEQVGCGPAYARSTRQPADPAPPSCPAETRNWCRSTNRSTTGSPGTQRPPLRHRTPHPTDDHQR